MSASQNKPWLRFIKRDRLQGGGRGNVTKVPFRGEAAYVRRLRRLEVVILHLTMRLELKQEVLDRVLQDMLDMRDAPGDTNERNEVLVSQEGPPDGEDSGEAGAVLSARSLPRDFPDSS